MKLMALLYGVVALSIATAAIADVTVLRCGEETETSALRFVPAGKAHHGRPIHYGDIINIQAMPGEGGYKHPVVAVRAVDEADRGKNMHVCLLGSGSAQRFRLVPLDATGTHVVSSRGAVKERDYFRIQVLDGHPDDYLYYDPNFRSSGVNHLKIVQSDSASPFAVNPRDPDGTVEELPTKTVKPSTKLALRGEGHSEPFFHFATEGGWSLSQDGE